MNYTATVTQKGQVTIPIDIRKYLDVKPSDQVVFEKKNNEIVVKPAKSFLDLEGSIKTNIVFDDHKADKLISKHVGNQYKKKEARTRY